eukprot:403338751
MSTLPQLPKSHQLPTFAINKNSQQMQQNVIQQQNQQRFGGEISQQVNVSRQSLQHHAIPPHMCFVSFIASVKTVDLFGHYPVSFDINNISGTLTKLSQLSEKTENKEQSQLFVALNILKKLMLSERGNSQLQQKIRTELKAFLSSFNIEGSVREKVSCILQEFDSRFNASKNFQGDRSQIGSTNAIQHQQQSSINRNEMRNEIIESRSPLRDVTSPQMLSSKVVSTMSAAQSHDLANDLLGKRNRGIDQIQNQNQSSKQAVTKRQKTNDFNQEQNLINQQANQQKQQIQNSEAQENQMMVDLCDNIHPSRLSFINDQLSKDPRSMRSNDKQQQLKIQQNVSNNLIPQQNSILKPLDLKDLQFTSNSAALGQKLPQGSSIEMNGLLSSPSLVQSNNNINTNSQSSTFTQTVSPSKESTSNSLLLCATNPNTQNSNEGQSTQVQKNARLTFQEAKQILLQVESKEVSRVNSGGQVQPTNQQQSGRKEQDFEKMKFIQDKFRAIQHCKQTNPAVNPKTGSKQ